FKSKISEYIPERVTKITGVEVAELEKAARLYGEADKAMIIYCMGITQHTCGTDNVKSCANLAMLTGNIGKLSSGVNPLRGQNNVQGACDLGALPNVITGYQQVADEKVRQKFEKAWGVQLSAEPGIVLTEMFHAMGEGHLKAVYLMGENPVLSDPDANHIKEALGKVEFLVVQDIFLTETAQYADVVLPAASFAEKEGTFSNTERRVQRVRKVLEPVGESKADWEITCAIAKKMEAKGYDFADAQKVFEEIAKVTPSYGGLSYERLDNEGGLQWPCPDAEHPGTKFLHKGNIVRGKGRFAPLTYRPSDELPDAEYPLILTTGRSPYHYHTGTMTRKAEGLNILGPEERVWVNPEDAQSLGIIDGEMVTMTSRRGTVEARARVTDKSQRGVVFMTFHYAEASANVLTNPALDPVCKTPEFKVCAVKVEKQSEPVAQEAEAAIEEPVAATESPAEPEIAAV
ncbi:MAG: molybdopterin-dependent oxidoreductase, partial [Chloroflexi bacterium]|nr:molybdopterin-dependent oxidoreductase [Chloroflexota bacterium]